MNYLVIKTKKLREKSKIETVKKIWIDEFVCLRIKTYSLNYGDDKKNKLKVVSEFQPNHNKFEEYQKCLLGENIKKSVKTIF